MSASGFTKPILLTLKELKANPKLCNHMAILSNAAFLRSHEPEPEKWNIPPKSLRFPNTESIHALIGEEGVVSVILDETFFSNGDEDLLVEVPDGNGGTKKGKLIASGATIPWRGGWEKEGAVTEKGWEFKAIVVDGDEKYLKKGLANQMCAALEQRVIEIERTLLKQPATERKMEPKGTLSADGKKGEFRLYLLVAECINGPYWRKRGYEEVRRKTFSGEWNCKPTASFEMVVYKRDVGFNIH